ncbi:hypothetical protein PHYSODRAFT_487043 [Phytophthora sojae]|uniref:Uncharacterized protein n=1 Tax=Phytophthora sojae (strain P6497) TaxID=1094619 RepID=G4YVU4_PHYSP|nr:hypothetical protein PHYSODRAFT_487043 [Phytophthora sojae]EGZ23192.1 hypothetical protein PHYSODRAFT_487043 [Phytophthora sojae]|eukprot:XP_009518480.1 hypothetical protein PHYSODRAFT_487043 [Phytophthora sojae]
MAVQEKQCASSSEFQVEREWLHAASNGDVDRMKVLREKCPKWLDLDRIDVNSADPPDEAEVLWTSRFCSWDGFHLSTIGASALHTATWHGDKKIMEYLLEEGQDPDSGGDTGITAVMLAVMRHNLQATRCIFRGRVAIQRNLVLDVRPCMLHSRSQCSH